MKKGLLLLIAAGSLLSCAISKKSSKANSVQSLAIAKADTTKKDSTKKIRLYNEVITSNAVTDDGLIKVHRINSKYFFEIADSILGKDILVVNRISKAAEGVRPFNGMLGYAGDYIGENVVRFEKGPDNKLFMKRISYLDISKDSSENGMYRSVVNSAFLPIVGMFDIQTYSPDSSSSVIDVTDFIKSDNDVLFFNPDIKIRFGLGGYQADKSYVETVRSYPVNTEIKTVKTYLMGSTLISYELNSSMVLLPANPMKSRAYDARVGYFARGYRDFDYPQAAKPSYIITRWRLEPKEKDIEKYKRGELVEPKKPIVFYIDPATPKKWVPYLIQGVNAWQKAFEKAGFKNAIYALESPGNDTTWSLEDARHNVIVYKSSFVENASGPQISDPRSGEILESHINWYHNIQQLLHDWYFIQASPNDPAARKMEFDDTLMGKLICYVCTHEVGHTLGLQHNFIASSTVPVDSLRSKRYVALNGHTPSIMDYARFNYVAQPEDGIAVNDLIPRIGVYDEWAIEWGYKWLPELNTNEEEKAFLNKWIIKRLNEDGRLVFATDRFPEDFRGQIEDLGDNAIKASYYGIKNLKRVMTHLEEWTMTPNSDYRDLSTMQNAVISQFYRYVNHVSEYIGGTTVTPKSREQSGPILTFANREQQKAAVWFLHDQLFNNTEWLCSKQLMHFSGRGPILMLYNLQQRILHQLLGSDLYNSFRENKSYSYDEFLTDMEAGIWKELNTNAKIDEYRRNLQRIYVSKLIDFLHRDANGDFSRMDVYTNVLDHVNLLYRKTGSAIKEYTDPASLSHLKDLHTRLGAALDFQKKYSGEPPMNFSIIVPKAFGNEMKDLIRDPSIPAYYQNNLKGCWNVSNDWLDLEK